MEWLARGEGAMTAAAGQAEARRRESPLRGLEQLVKRDADLAADLIPDGPDAAFRRAALVRFARRLDDCDFPGAPWSQPQQRRELLSAAARFIVAVDGAFEYSGKVSPDADSKTAKGRLFHDTLLVRNTSSPGAYAIWADAILDLFARRAYGLGERTGAAFDAHSPAAGPRIPRKSLAPPMATAASRPTPKPARPRRRAR
jgi:hypothetical protein